ncbi:MAG: hypothetical protein JW874_07525 [Spirochaetales bacterium]|nr:hypothetical protein [Spirochaetales bacterium]
MKAITFGLCVVILITACQTGQSIKMNESDFIPDTLKKIHAEYDSSPDIRTDLLIMPFFPVCYTAEYHIIAFIEDHPEYESVEAFIFDVNNSVGDPLVRAILTRHDKVQIDYASFPLPDNPGRESYRTIFTFNLEDGGKKAMLCFRDRDENEYVLEYASASAPEARWGGMTDTRGHSPDGGLPLFCRERSSIAGRGSCVRINGKAYAVPEDPEATHKPFFTGYAAYLSMQYHTLIFPTGRIETGLDVLAPATGAGSFTAAYGKSEIHITYSDSRVVPEIIRIRFSSSFYSPEFSYIITFDPVFPNISALKTGSEVLAGFSINFLDRKNSVKGKVIIRKTGNRSSTVLFLPGTPAEAVRNRQMEYSLIWENEKIYIQAVMLGST